MPKRRQAPDPIRLVVADNIKARMKWFFDDAGDKPKALANAAKTSISTVQRILDADVAAELDTLARIAHALDLAVYQLFLPNLHPSNPQAIKNATKAEERLYDQLAALNRQRPVKS